MWLFWLCSLRCDLPHLLGHHAFVVHQLRRQPLVPEQADFPVRGFVSGRHVQGRDDERVHRVRDHLRHLQRWRCERLPQLQRQPVPAGRRLRASVHVPRLCERARQHLHTELSQRHVRQCCRSCVHRYVAARSPELRRWVVLAVALTCLLQTARAAVRRVATVLRTA